MQVFYHNTDRVTHVTQAFQECINDCTKALNIDPDFVKARCPPASYCLPLVKRFHPDDC